MLSIVGGGECDGSKSKFTYLKNRDFFCLGITGSKELHVSSAQHRAVIEVNEQGTEASAATIVSIGFRSGAKVGSEFRCDHPFLFLIRSVSERANCGKDFSTGSIIYFVGRFAEPTEKISDSDDSEDSYDYDSEDTEYKEFLKNITKRKI